MQETTPRERTSAGTNATSSRYWRSQPDDSREAWAFLSIERPESPTTLNNPNWALATANAAQLVQIYGREIETAEKLTPLHDRLNTLRLNEAIMFTPTEATLRYLRTHLLSASHAEDPTLRGLSHLPLIETIDEHFAEPERLQLPIDVLREQPSIGTSPEEVVRACWQVRTAIGHLLPSETIRGDSL